MRHPRHRPDFMFPDFVFVLVNIAYVCFKRLCVRKIENQLLNYPGELN